MKCVKAFRIEKDLKMEFKKLELRKKKQQRECILAIARSRLVDWTEVKNPNWDHPNVDQPNFLFWIKPKHNIDSLVYFIEVLWSITSFGVWDLFIFNLWPRVTKIYIILQINFST